MIVFTVFREDDGINVDGESGMWSDAFVDLLTAKTWCEANVINLARDMEIEVGEMLWLDSDQRSDCCVLYHPGTGTTHTIMQATIQTKYPEE